MNNKGEVITISPEELYTISDDLINAIGKIEG